MRRSAYHRRLSFCIVHMGVEQHCSVVVRCFHSDGESVAAILQSNGKRTKKKKKRLANAGIDSSCAAILSRMEPMNNDR